MFLLELYRIFHEIHSHREVVLWISHTSLPPTKSMQTLPPLACSLDLPNVPSEGWKKASPALLLGYNAVVVWIGRKRDLIKNFFRIFYGENCCGSIRGAGRGLFSLFASVVIMRGATSRDSVMYGKWEGRTGKEKCGGRR